MPSSNPEHAVAAQAGRGLRLAGLNAWAEHGRDVYLGPGVVLLIFVATSVVTYLNTQALFRSSESVSHTHEVLIAVRDMFSLMQDAETGQRGYLITGEPRYLEPYSAAISRIPGRLTDLQRLTADNAAQQAAVQRLRGHVETKLNELQNVIALRRDEGLDAARNLIVADRGKAAMDAIRAEIEEMNRIEADQRAQRIRERQNAHRTALVSGAVTGVLGVVLSIVLAVLLARRAAARRQQDWLQTGQIGLNAQLAGDKRIEQLAEKTLKYLSEYLDAQAGAFFTREASGFRRVATYGVPAGISTPERFELHDGLLGQAARDGRRFVLHDVPDGYLKFGSALGSSNPRQLAIIPLQEDGIVNGVVELGFVQPLAEARLELLEEMSASVGSAIRSANYRAHLQDLLEETQRQSEELQAQSEELRVSNEELEEQGRALRESQVRLEQQQAELEQTNSQLQEQAEQLELQRDEAARARSALEVQAGQLEQASQYKSDFLANMSHELRTPLNSLLILAKLLADNPHGNLSDEQVQFATTIRASGNDLLNLINDILDLSKIEAGRMEVRSEEFGVAGLVDDLGRTFAPLASQKGVALRCEFDEGAPDRIQTDRQRLEQILKNLVSNAIKFTEHGEVLLRVAAGPPGRISFAVRDTGIGIPPQQQDIIFEAFRQADGTTNRKYGGTGLGLSISRELARLLGGAITLVSEVGQGSTFTVTLPVTFAPLPPGVERAPATTTAIRSPLAAPAAPRDTRTPGAAGVPARGPAPLTDDRAVLTPGRRVILIVEDDEPFARILADLAKEQRFDVLIANSAEQAIALTLEFLPHAIILDIGLPDHSGLTVLDRLKHDPRTRHIPVHVVSASDSAQTALALGAVGYMLKPVQREELVRALQQLEQHLDQHLRRVLVVEDDAVQRESLKQLLGSKDVEIVAVGSAAECLEALGTTTFDCMVLDLSLPDASGYSLLESLSTGDRHAFPPVIVYTGRDLSADQEQQLRRYSQSIIIKGAKSPERLLDEVTLFLHQVVSDLPADQRRMLERARSRDATLEGRRILVVEDDIRNVFAVTSILEPRGAVIQIARNGREAIDALERSSQAENSPIDLVLMDVMMPEMDGITAVETIRRRPDWRKLPIIMLTAKAMANDQERCLKAGANDYLPKPLDVDKLLSLVRVWMPR